MPSIAHDKLRSAIAAIVAAGGSANGEPELVAENLVTANLYGHDSHGVGMIPAYIEAVNNGALNVNQHAEIVRDEGSMIVVDGHAGYGQVIGREAMQFAIDRTKQHGVSVLALRNSFHLCRIGAWAEMAAAEGMVSMHHTNVLGHGALVAPWRGSDARYVTNPYTAVMPATESNPDILLDFATSFVAAGKIRVARNKGEPAPEGSLIDSQGQPTRDPMVLYEEPKGALMPFGEHKGYGLALLNELFAGVLSGGGTCRPEQVRNPPAIINNMLAIVIDPMRLVDPDYRASETDTAIAHVKASPAADPARPVLVPGDPERSTSDERTANGIPVDDETWREILAAGVSVGLSEAEINQIAGVSA